LILAIGISTSTSAQVLTGKALESHAGCSCALSVLIVYGYTGIMSKVGEITESILSCAVSVISLGCSTQTITHDRLCVQLALTQKGGTIDCWRKPRQRNGCLETHDAGAKTYPT